MTALRDGQMMALRIEGEEVLLCRVDGEFHALANRCSHAGQALHTGRLVGHEVICPLHGARFDVRDGRCSKGPGGDGVRRYRVWLEGGKVNVSMLRN
jgi:naphthalene 1,2-dioxygenase system ferredoxin subunit